MVRNVTEPEFGSGADAFDAERQARAGVAVSSANARRRSALRPSRSTPT